MSARACSTSWPRQACVATQAGDGRSERVHRLRRGRQPFRIERTGAGIWPVGSRWSGPITGPEEGSRRVVRPALDEIANPVAAIDQPASFAVDLAEDRLAGEHALQTRRVWPLVGGRLRRCGRRRRRFGHAVMVAVPVRERRRSVSSADGLEDDPDDDRAEERDEDGGDEALTLVEAHLAGQPTADDRAEIFLRRLGRRPGRPAADYGPHRAPPRKPITIRRKILGSVCHVRCVETPRPRPRTQGRGCDGRRAARRRSPRPCHREARASSASVSSRNGAAHPRPQLEHGCRRRPGPRVTPPSTPRLRLSSVRSDRPAQPAQIGHPKRGEVGGGIRTISLERLERGVAVTGLYELRVRRSTPRVR